MARVAAVPPPSSPRHLARPHRERGRDVPIAAAALQPPHQTRERIRGDVLPPPPLLRGQAAPGAAGTGRCSPRTGLCSAR